LISINDFKPLSLSDKKNFDAHFQKYPPVHSDNLFTTMISWMDYAKYHYLFYKGNLLLMTEVGNNIQFRPPSGKFSKDVFDEVLKLAKKEGSDPPFGMIDSLAKEWFSKNYLTTNYFFYKIYIP